MICSAINAGSLSRGLHFCPGQDQPCPGFLLLIFIHFKIWVYDEPTMTHKCPWLFCRAAPQCLGHCHWQIRPVFMLQWHGWACAKVCRIQLVILCDELLWWNLLRYMMWRQSGFFLSLLILFFKIPVARAFPVGVRATQTKYKRGFKAELAIVPIIWQWPGFPLRARKPIRSKSHSGFCMCINTCIDGLLVFHSLL